MHSVLMIFLDGIGIGKADFEMNPFFKYGFKTFSELFGELPSLDNQKLTNDDYRLFPVDALLGVDGLPQSGTGQTSIFCGINAAEKIGKHFGPFPYSTLIPVIEEQNIFRHLMELKKKVFFANAYPAVFFDYLRSGKQRLSVTSLSCRLSGVRLNRVTDVRKGRALTAEITNERWNKKLGYNLPVIQPKTAARRLLKIAADYSFTLYEYFLTDHAGHGREAENLENILLTVDEFLYTILTEFNKEKLSVFVCSDHGNLEDISIKTHTFNPSLAIAAGKHSEELSKKIKNLTQIKKALVDII